MQIALGTAIGHENGTVSECWGNVILMAVMPIYDEKSYKNRFSRIHLEMKVSIQYLKFLCW